MDLIFQWTGCYETIAIKDEGFSDGLKKTDKAISNLAKKLIELFSQ